MRALTDLHAEPAGPQVIPLLADVAPAVRVAAADYLGRFPAPQCAASLQNALQAEQDDKVRGRMARALQRASSRPDANPYAPA